MRVITLAKRNFKEIMRDPITLVFSIFLPIFLLFIFQQFDIPDEIYSVKNFAPGIIIFGYAFLSLFTASLIANDRSTSLLTRLFASPVKPFEYIFGYTLAVIPISIIQSIVFFISAIILGLPFNINILVTVLVNIPLSLIFISLGILIGSLVSASASGGVGSIIVQLVAFTSGMYFDIDNSAKALQIISDILPFKYALDVTRNSLGGNLFSDMKGIIILIIYIILIFIIASFTFKSKMNSDNK